MDTHKKNKSKTLRQKILMIYHDDGILDLVVGITILMLAAVMAFETPTLIGLIGIPLILYIPVKEQISIPRIGLIRFEAENSSRKRMVFLLLSGIVTFAVFVFLAFLIRNGTSSSLVEMIANNEVLIFAFILSGTLIAVSRALNNTRFQLYSILSLVLVLGGYFIGIRIWLPVTLTGLSMEILGILKLISFLRSYPTAEEA